MLQNTASVNLFHGFMQRVVLLSDCADVCFSRCVGRSLRF